MKIMTVANSIKVKGGITSVVNSLTEGITNKEPRITMGKHDSYIEQVAPLLRILYSLIAMCTFIFKLPFYTIYHLHAATDGSFYRKSIYVFICKLFNKKVIFHMHGASFEEFHDHRTFNAWLIRTTLNKVDGVIVLSEHMKSLVLSYCDNQKIWILLNPIKVPDLLNQKVENTENGKVELLFMGEIGQRKGIYDLITSLTKLPLEVQQSIQLHICGNNEMEKLKAHIETENVASLCMVHGWTVGESKIARLIAADIFILPSYHEGLPVSILEAMAYQLPIISTGVGGIPEIVRHNENGFIITPGSIEELASSITKLVTDREIRLNFGKKSGQLVSHHDVDLVVEELIGIYREISSRVG